MAWTHIGSSHWRGTVGWTLTIKGLCSLPNIDLLCCYMAAGIICKQYQPWYRDCSFFLCFCQPPDPFHSPSSLFSFKFHACLCLLRICNFFHPLSINAMFGTRSPVPNYACWLDPCEFSFFVLFFPLCTERATLWVDRFLVQTLVLITAFLTSSHRFRQKQTHICRQVWYSFFIHKYVHV